MGVSNFFICEVASYLMRALVCVGEVDTSHLNFVHCGLVFSSHGLIGVCELLLSARGGYLNGTSIPIDGGWTAS